MMIRGRAVLPMLVLIVLASAPAAAQVRTYSASGPVTEHTLAPTTKEKRDVTEVELEGGPAPRPTRIWSVRSSQVPADWSYAFSPPIAVIVDVDAGDFSRRGRGRWERGRPGRPDRSGPRR